MSFREDPLGRHVHFIDPQGIHRGPSALGAFIGQRSFEKS